jgi:hypothetical protein
MEQRCKVLKIGDYLTRLLYHVWGENARLYGAALRIGDKLPPGFDGPAKELAPANLGDGQFVHLVAS